MAQRNIMCAWSPCCKTILAKEDDGEWFEEIPQKKKKKKRSTKKKKNGNRSTTTKSNKAKANWGRVQAHVDTESEVKREVSIRWSDVLDKAKVDDALSRSHSAPIRDTETGSILKKKRYKSTYGDSNNTSSLMAGEIVGGSSPLMAKDADDLGDDGLSSGSDHGEHTKGRMKKKKFTMFGGKEKKFTPNMFHEFQDDVEKLTSSGKEQLHDLKDDVAGLTNKTAHILHLDKLSLSSATTDSPESLGDSNHTDDSSKRKTMKKKMTVFGSKTGKKMTLFGDALKNSFTSSTSENSDRSSVRSEMVTSISVLGNGYYLTASRQSKTIKMFRTEGMVGSRIDLVREFVGHKSGVADIAVLDDKGRFLSSGMDKTIRLWDSRFNCDDDIEDEEEENDGRRRYEPVILLATWCDADRWVHTIGILSKGSYVRPTDDIDADMLKAMAKKTALEGNAAVQIAAAQREIIECSGRFISASKNDTNVSVWDVAIAKKTEDASPDKNVADLTLAEVIKHDAHIESMVVAANGLILVGDSMGEVVLFSRSRKSMFGSSDTFVKTCKYAQRASLSSPEAIMEQAITHLSFLEGNSKFVAGSRNGSVRVWKIPGKTSRAYRVVNKKEAISMKITRLNYLSGIQALPPMKDPSSGDMCLAFSAASTDGKVISIALSGESDLAMIHVYDHSSADQDGDLDGTDDSIHSLAVLEGAASNPVLIVGDSNGATHLVKPIWGPQRRTLSGMKKESQKNIFS